jgi:hypothetical protein
MLNTVLAMAEEKYGVLKACDENLRSVLLTGLTSDPTGSALSQLSISFPSFCF